MQADAIEARAHRANTAGFTDIFTVVNPIPLSAAQKVNALFRSPFDIFLALWMSNITEFPEL